METVLTTVAEPGSSYEAMTGYYETRQPIDANGEPAEALGLLVGSKYFDVLGVAPAQGRLFAVGGPEAQAEPDDTVLISDSLWRRQFGRRPDIIGESITIGGQRRTIVGVLPASHRPLVAGVEFWLPMRIDREDFSDYEATAQVLLLGHLARDHSIDAAAVQLATTAQRLRDEAPASYSESWVASSRPSPLHTVLVRDVQLAVWMVMGAVGFLLLIACANVANLLMVRSVSRRADVAVRVGLGATPWRIVRLRLTEGAVLGLVGGGLGALLALFLVRVIRSAGASTLALGDRIDANLSFLAFTCAVTLIASLVSSAGPALAAARSQPHLLLRSGGRGSTASGGSLRLNLAVVGLAVALAVVLVIGSTLMLQTVIHLSQVDPGFRAEGVPSMRVRFPDHGALSEPAARTRFLDDVVESLERIPGAGSAASVSFLPMATGTPSASYKVGGVVYPDDAPPPFANFQLVIGDYRTAMGIPLRRGRWFEPTDAADSPVVGVINEALARKAFGDVDPLDRTITMFGGIEFRVIGVLGDTRQRRPSESPAPEATFAYRQLPYWPGMFLTVRSDGRAPTSAELRHAVSDVQRSVPVSEFDR